MKGTTLTLACASSNLASPANENSDFQEIESCYFFACSIGSFLQAENSFSNSSIL